MNLTSRAKTQGTSLAKHCDVLVIEATDHHEVELLAAIHRVVVYGGKIEVTPAGEKGLMMAYPDPRFAEASR